MIYAPPLTGIVKLCIYHTIFQLNNDAERIHQDAINFDDFLKQTDQGAVEAMLEVEKETKLKMKKVSCAMLLLRLLYSYLQINVLYYDYYTMNIGMIFLQQIY